MIILLTRRLCIWNLMKFDMQITLLILMKKVFSSTAGWAVPYWDYYLAKKDKRRENVIRKDYNTLPFFFRFTLPTAFSFTNHYAK